MYVLTVLTAKDESCRQVIRLLTKQERQPAQPGYEPATQGMRLMVTADATEERSEQRIAFVKLPEAIDCANIRMVMDSLASALVERPSVLIADGTELEFCDCAGITALVCAERWAAAIGKQLRVVVPSLLVRRAIELIAADEVLDVYTTMDSALADMTGNGVALPPRLPPLTDETEAPHGRRRQPDR